MQLSFLGAARTVTGSKYLLTYQGRNILIDCGLFQGVKESRLKNWDSFAVDPKNIDAVILTHAHIDHSGYIPRLIKEGFEGPVYCTEATYALCKLLLPDAGYLQEEEAGYLNRRKLSKHNPALPLFTQLEAERSLNSFLTRPFNSKFEVVPGVHVQFLYAGHILGAAMAIVSLGSTTIGFSGDLGRQNDPILKAPALLPNVDFLVLESTYGNRRHEGTDPELELEKIIHQAVERRGVIVIPAFTVGRAQALMFYLASLKNSGRIPEIPMYLNSPMAANVTDILKQFSSLHKLSERQCQETCAVVEYVKSVDESKALNEKKGPMLIISASGMITGGRVLHHIKAFAPNSKNHIVLAGFQAAGTRGRRIQDGEKEVKIFREYVPIRAKVHSFENMSAHADYTEIMEWLRKSGSRPKKIFLTHGESDAADALKGRLETEFQVECDIPQLGQSFQLEGL